MLGFLPDKFWILLTSTFIVSALAQFFAPAEQAAMPLLVRKENFMAANALYGSTMMGALIVGFAIGEPILTSAKALFGENFGQEAVVGILYTFSALAFQLINFNNQDRVTDEQQIRINAWHELKAGLKYIQKNRLVLNAMLQITTLYCVFASLMVLAIRLATEFGLKEKQFGFFLAAAGVGMVIGAAILGHWGDKLHHKPLSLIGFLMMAVVLGFFTFTSNLFLALGLCALLGIGAALINVPMQTLIQHQTPMNMYGKVFGFQNHVVNIALSLPLAITGPLTDSLGLRTVLITMSIVVVAIGFWSWHNTRRFLRDFL
jgi:predicted MFS family arabinose efflux permease